MGFSNHRNLVWLSLFLIPVFIGEVTMAKAMVGLGIIAFAAFSEYLKNNKAKAIEDSFELKLRALEVKIQSVESKAGLASMQRR